MSNIKCKGCTEGGQGHSEECTLYPKANQVETLQKALMQIKKRAETIKDSATVRMCQTALDEIEGK